MQPPPGWQNPIVVQPGQMQYGVDPLDLLAGRGDLVKHRLEFQHALLMANLPRLTPIEVTHGRVILDGHHAVKPAAEAGRTVDVLVMAKTRIPEAASILALPVR